MSDSSQTAIIHCRISSTRQKDGESHKAQEEACRFVASRYQARVLKVWEETFSGRKHKRHFFDSILKEIDSWNTPPTYYIIRAIDRFTRAGSAEYEMMKKELARRNISLIDSYGIIQPPQNTLEHLGFSYDWSVQSPSDISEVVVAQQSKTEVTTILTRMIGQEIRLTKEGYKVRYADDGYVTKRIFVGGKKKLIQVPDPERAKYFQEMFALRAAGTHSDKEIVKRINAMGYRSREFKKWNAKRDEVIGTGGGNPLTVKQLQRVIQRPIYAGVICEKWTHYQPIRAKYKGLVSIDTFNHANRGKVFIKESPDDSLQMLYDNVHTTKPNKKRRNDNPTYAFKFIRCPYCPRSSSKGFLGSAPKGKSGQRFPTYHCNRNHKYFGVGKAEFEDSIRQYFRKLRLRPDAMDHFEVQLLEKYREAQKTITVQSTSIDESIADLKTRKAAALDAFITARQPTVRAELEQRIAVLEQSIANADTDRSQLALSEADLHKFVLDAKYLMEHLEEVLIPRVNKPNYHAQRALFGLVFEEMPTYHEILNGTPKLSLPFQFSSDSGSSKSQLVGRQSLRWNTHQGGWNTLEELVLNWQRVFQQYHVGPSYA